MEGGFIDLRQQSDGNSTGNDSFWPSFTDIMMVIVMIFMIASTALMLRNQELVQKLRETLLAELQAEERARSMTEASATLEEQLASAQHANSELRIRLLRVTERGESLVQQLSDKEQRLLVLEADLRQSQQQSSNNKDRWQQSREELAQQAAQLAALRQRHEDTLTELAHEETRQQQQLTELAALRLESSLTEQQLMALQDEYSQLQVRYDKLFKPARSARGKHVVTVRYWKEAGKYQLRIKDLNEQDYRSISREQLHRQLAALKEKYPAQLYVKLIIPDDSGLSYNEAWGFTVEMLDKYDYYHQK